MERLGYRPALRLPALALAPDAVAVVSLLAAVAATLSGHVAPIGTGDSGIFASAARSLAAGHGYHSAFEASGVPRYPPGFPLLLVPAAWVGSDAAMQATSLILGVLLVAAVWACARRLGGNLAATAAGVLILLSPLLRLAGTEVMADTPAALCTVLGLWGVAAGRERLAGLAMGAACWMRLDAVAQLPGLGWRRALAVAAAVVGALVAVQVFLHQGNPIGYAGGQASFGLQYLWGGTVYESGAVRSALPNWEFFPSVLIGAGGWVMPGLALLGGLGLWRHRAERPARLAAWVVVATLAVHLVYYFQSARFLLSAACVLVIYGGVAVSDIVRAALTPKHGRPPAADRRHLLPPSATPESP
jgi:4-amino-4-deoxy-L-arabinose transferase-like glycosyltransferase